MHISSTRLDPPTNCDVCSSNRVGLTDNKVLYGESKGEWPYCYYCDDCGAMVTCHPNTYAPMGKMANSAVRRMRVRLHELLDPIWQNNWLTRYDCYVWLGKELGIKEECHISNLNHDQIKLALHILKRHKDAGYVQFIRRKEKRNDKRNEQRDRQKKRVFLRRRGY